jgi:hypothetical protein
VKSGDRHNFLRASLLILMGLVALVVAPFQGSLEVAGLGALAFVLGSAFLAYLIWDLRNPVPPARFGFGADEGQAAKTMEHDATIRLRRRFAWDSE